MRTATWKSSRLAYCIPAALGLLLALAGCRAKQPTETHAPVPRLVVLIVVDQLRYDLIDRYRPLFARDGFERFLREGASFTQAAYLHATTDTCPGHAVIATGYWGRDNGVIANQWFDDDRKARVPCAAPDRATFARKLKKPTIGDVIDQATRGRSRIIVASGKSGAAQLLGGRSADGVFWPDRDGRFVSWREKRWSLPGWARRFNANDPAQAYFHRTWDRLLPPQAYALVGTDDEPGERRAHAQRETFPRSLTGGDSRPGPRSQAALRASPFTDELVIDFALAALRAERLGDDPVTDLLAVSLSASDQVAHEFGPDSHESMDTILRLDRQLARLLAEIDEQVGLDRTLVVLTADHGIAPLPEVANRQDPRRGAIRFSRAKFGEVAERALRARYGEPPDGKWVAYHDYPNLYLDRAALRARDIPAADAERVAAGAIEAVPGVASTWPRAELERLEREGARSDFERALRLSFVAGRSGHVVYQLQPYHVVTDVGTNHGSAWPYDARVPLLWLGPGIRPGAYQGGASPADIAPTIYVLLGIADTVTAGRVLSEMRVSAPDVLPASPAGG